MYKLKILLLTVIIAFILLKSSNATNDINEPRVKACGEALADTVALVCQGKYNGKRSGKYTFGNPIDLDKYVKYETYQTHLDNMLPYPLQSKFAASMIRPIRYKRQVDRVGIVDECCINACSYREISGYCSIQRNYEY